MNQDDEEEMIEIGLGIVRTPDYKMTATESMYCEYWNNGRAVTRVGDGTYREFQDGRCVRVRQALLAVCSRKLNQFL